LIMTQAPQPTTASGRFCWDKLCRSVFAGFLFAAVIAAASPAQSSPPTDKTKVDAAGYLKFVLDYVQSHAFHRTGVDWPRIREQALARAPHPASTVETYDPIRFALAGLRDHGSSLRLTPALETLEAQRTHNSPAIAPKDNPRSGPYSARSSPEGRIEKAGSKLFALVVVPKCVCDNPGQASEYATKLQRMIAQLDQSHPSGWIVDLRGHAGDNMWPMLAGVGPLLGEGDRLGESVTNHGRYAWQYRDGVASEVGGKEKSSVAVQGAPYKLAGTPKVAVLMDGSTSGSGEGIAIAFRGRPNTRFFGEYTAGLSSITETVLLVDGASLTLVTGMHVDRTGKEYFEGLGPDEMVPAATRLLPDDQDQVLQQALWWLNITM
jgi:hypothetical protein